MLAGCGGGSKNAGYIKNSADYVSYGIDTHDIDRVVERAASSLLASDYTRDIRGKKLVVIADIINETAEDVDIELIARKLAREMRKSKKYSLTNALAGSGSKVDRFIKDSRGLQRDPRFNQHSTQEDGTLLAPELSLSGKLLQRSKKLGKVTRLDYIFLLTLSDLKSGRVVWDHEEVISKVTDSRIERGGQGEDKELRTLREQCRGENADACETLIEKGYIKELQRLCDTQGIVCWFAGNYFSSQNDIPSAKEWYRKGCDGDDGISCGALGFLYDSATNYAQAFRLYTKACGYDILFACQNLGHLYLNGLGVKKDAAKAFELYVRICEGGVGLGCYNAGLMLSKGEAGTKKNFIKERSFYNKGCELNHNLACYLLGAMYHDGVGGKKDHAKALALYGKSCDLGLGDACSDAALGYGDKNQYGQARKFAEKGCDELNSGNACAILGAMYGDGLGVRQDFKKAKELCGKACDLGEQVGCDYYHQLRDAGY